jgi:hypothetical protein
MNKWAKRIALAFVGAMATVKPASAKPPADPSNPAETTQPRTP